MKVIERRLRTLEERFGPRQRTESPLLAIVLERRRGRAQAEGWQYVEPEKSQADTRGMTLTQILRLRYKRPRTNDKSSNGGATVGESAKTPAKA
jgi:hypothetical protein